MKFILFVCKDIKLVEMFGFSKERFGSVFSVEECTLKTDVAHSKLNLSHFE
jgi:hypothetical protein